MWWLQTKNPNIPIDIWAYTIPNLPKIGLPANSLTIWLTIPKPGKIKI